MCMIKLADSSCAWSATRELATTGPSRRMPRIRAKSAGVNQGRWFANFSSRVVDGNTCGGGPGSRSRRNTTPRRSNRACAAGSGGAGGAARRSAGTSAKSFVAAGVVGSRSGSDPAGRGIVECRQLASPSTTTNAEAEAQLHFRRAAMLQCSPIRILNRCCYRGVETVSPRRQLPASASEAIRAWLRGSASLRASSPPTRSPRSGGSEPRK